MKYKQRIFSVLIAFALLFSSVAPAFAANSQAADKVQVQFQNKTGAPVRISFTGLASVSFNLGTGKTKAELAPGTYKYSYQACDKTNIGTFKVRSNGDTPSHCPSVQTAVRVAPRAFYLQSEMILDQALYFVFTGPKTYYFTVLSGPTGKLTVEAGKYKYTVSGYGCGGYSEDTGTLNLKGNFKWRWYCG